MKTTKTKPETSRRSVFNKINKTVDKRVKRGKIKGVNDAKPNDRLEILTAKYEKEIQVKEGELAVLKAKLRSLKDFASESETLREPEPSSDKYASMGLTEAIADAAGYLWRVGKGTAHGVTAGQIRDFILAHGFPLNPDTRVFNVSIHVTLGRLVTAEKLKVAEDGGNNFYKPVQSLVKRGWTTHRIRLHRPKRISGTGGVTRKVVASSATEPPPLSPT
ncbi:MAG TPA: hypothetical protein VGN23_10485 [Verrucomicrobiae bacterium]|jgi:hypothetical protein